MFNLNIPPSSLLGIDGSGLCSTPKTPEILNSLIAMTNPMDNYNFSAVNSAASTPGSNVTVRNFNANANVQCISQDSSHSSCSASPLDSPAGTNTTPSVQQTCSQLIKAGLKLSIQSKRKLSTCESSSGSEQPNSKCSRRDEDCDDSSDDDSENKSMTKGLTPEDEDRRRRRRERNKIAATKCRMKKRERTQNLIKESEQLDTQNVELKNQVRTLERERRKLLDMLNGHAPTCLRRGGFSLPTKLQQSPAYKYLADLDLEGCSSVNGTPTNTTCNRAQTQTPTHMQQQQQQLSPHQAQPRTAIPPMSTIKFSRSDNFKAAAAAVANNIAAHQLHQLTTQQQPLQQLHQQQQQQHLPNGYCKASPSPQELGYLNSPSQESVCLPSLHSALTSAAHQTASITVTTHQLNDYIPNCDNSLGLGLSLGAHTPTSTPTSINSNALIGGNVPSPLATIATPSTANEFVKNELVDSQSPYTTAQSAERFLFEGNCDSFVDIKHAVNLNNNTSNLNHNNIIDFHSSLAGSLVPFPEQISIKNDYLHEADFLAQLAAEGGEFVDLDTGVAAAFMTNGGCLA